MSSPRQLSAQKWLEKFGKSRDLTISFILHAILIAIFGTTVLFQTTTEPSDFQAEPGRFVENREAAPKIHIPPTPSPEQPNITPPTPATPNALKTITTINPLAPDFSKAPAIFAPISPALLPKTTRVADVKPAGLSPDGLSGAQASAIRDFTDGWCKGKNGIGSSSGTRETEFEFTAYIGQYSGGNWDSTISPAVNGQIVNGSLPNLLYFMSSWSKNKVKTNYKNVKAIKLESDEIFSVKPPFIFLTGTRDFRLSAKEVENLQNYVRLGGAIWGDSSVPGRNSRFDIAFRREMKRVIPDVDRDWEVVPPNHPIYTQAYFPEIKEIPTGLNSYREPAYCLKIYGEIAIIYTANDYGDMWQIGLTDGGQVDLRKDDRDQFVASRREIWDNRTSYLRNIDPVPLTLSYKFGTNVVIHLLTRWERKTRTALSL